MRTRLTVCAILAFLLSGCTYRSAMDPNSGPGAYRAASQALAERAADRATWGDRVPTSYDVRSTPDSTHGVRSASGIGRGPIGLSTQQGREITGKSRLRGALKGGAIGAGIGMAFGFVLGPDRVANNETRTDAGLHVAFYGALLGLIIGSIRGG